MLAGYWNRQALVSILVMLLVLSVSIESLLYYSLACVFVLSTSNSCKTQKSVTVAKDICLEKCLIFSIEIYLTSIINI